LTIDDLNGIFTSMRSEAVTLTDGQGFLRRRLDSSPTGDLYFVLSLADNRNGILLRTLRKSLPNAKDLPEADGFVVQRIAFPDDPPDTACLTILGKGAEYAPIFQNLLLDLANHVVSATRDRQVEAFLRRLTLWQRFFVRYGRGAMTIEDQAGLFAELVLLKEYLLPNLDARHSVEAWKGPSGAPQDFVTPTCAIEVKATRAKAGSRIRISNELQLDDTAFQRLVIALFALSEADESGRTVREQVQLVRDEVGHDVEAALMFEDRLLEGGWHPDAVGRTECRFAVRDMRTFHVRAGFPRILSEDFPSGVCEVTYCVEVSAAMPFLIDRQIFESWLR
jgi:hypothetical protein